MSKIMIVDDEENLLHSLKRILSKTKDLDIVTCNSPYEALDIATTIDIDMFISDYRMPGMNGVDFLVSTKQSNPHAIRLILSGATDSEGLVNAINQAEIYRFISKPVQPLELISTVKQALQHRKKQKELERRESTLKKLVESTSMISHVIRDHYE